MTQPTLFDDRTIQEGFEQFHARHPDVFDLFRRFASELRASGREHYGAKSLIERIRWHYATSSGGDVPKLNNNWTSRYVRKLIAEDETFEGFFELRTLKAE